MQTLENTKVSSIFIEGRLWFDKTGGNTYFSNRVWINGKILFIMPMEYGYDLQYLHRALQELEKRGLINSTSTWQLRDEQGINLYHVATYGKKSELFKD